jgi:hypothetical protein
VLAIYKLTPKCVGASYESGTFEHVDDAPDLLWAVGFAQALSKSEGRTFIVKRKGASAPIYHCERGRLFYSETNKEVFLVHVVEWN